MKSGMIVADRYELVRLAGTGGMAEVHRAIDRQTGQPVAFKLWNDTRPDDDVRFDREIEAVASLDHPGVVRYVGHGALPIGARYLVMEWLEGEDLAALLLRERHLAIEETITIARRVADALAYTHGRGVVHRDLKPGNVFLVGKRPEGAKILDFGIAKLGRRTRITGAGMLVGTPGYMAPEQVRGEADVDLRVDLFALGCLLFECLAGVAAFGGEDLHAVLAKVLFAEPSRLADLRRDVPEALEALVHRLLSKDPADRPQDGAEVLDALDRIEVGAAETVRFMPRSLPPASLGTAERRPVAALLIGRSRASLPPSSQSGVLEGRIAQQDRALQAAAEALGAPCEVLPDGSLALFTSGAAATDLAARTARIAMALQQKTSHRPFSLAVGWGALSGDNQLGDAIDRAAKSLTLRSSRALGEVPPIALDEVTAGLLDARFDVREDEDGFSLHGERPALPGARTLLGIPTACVGREREQRVLLSLFDDCIEESASQAVLVTAPVGFGKSRLAHEFVRDALARHENTSLWIAGSDARGGSSFGLASRALAMALGLARDPASLRRDKLMARLSSRFRQEEALRVGKFLGEIVDAPFPADDDPKLRAARVDVQLLLDQVESAFVAFVSAECDVAPVLLVLEDLQYGDLPSLRLVDAALRELPDKPLFVLALARPEVHERFPRLFSGRRFQELRLAELGRRASERLARQALGELAQKEVIERIVSRSEGNAFYLEELIRAEAEGRGEDLPETVVAMVQSRLASLSDEDRRILRAASVFGDVFWSGGVLTLLGVRSSGQTNIRARLGSLVAGEVLSVHSESRIAGEDELAFRHALVREGAYAMLTDDDRALGHRLAGDWLEKRGGADPLILAEHFERGGEAARAATFYLRAAELAHRAGDDDAALRRADRGLSLEPDEETRIGLLGVATETRVWRDQLDQAAAFGAKLTAMAPPGSAPWVRGALAQFTHGVRLGRIDDSLALLDVLRAIEPAPEVLATVSLSLAMAVALLVTLGRVDVVDPVHRRLDALLERSAAHDPLARAYGHLAYPRYLAWIMEDPWGSLLRARAALAEFTEADSRRGKVLARVFVGMNQWMLGEVTAARETLQSEDPLEGEFAIVASLRTTFLVLAQADAGALDEARRGAEALVAAARSKGSSGDEARGRWALADVLRRAGELELAERHARGALVLQGIAPLDRAAAESVLAAVCLAANRLSEALAFAEGAYSRYTELHAFGYRGSFLRLVRAEALEANGFSSEAHAALSEARLRLLSIAEAIPERACRESFLASVPQHARTFELSRMWGLAVD